jgi:xylose isomerase
MSDLYQPNPEHKFSFGLWTLGNRGRDPFGDAVRPSISPAEIVAMLHEVGAWGVNLHDNDLVPIEATPSDRDKIVRDFKRACEKNGIVVPMATVSLFFHPVFRDGAFTSNDPENTRLRRAEDDARHGHRRRARREDLRGVGRARRHRNGRMPSRG